MRTTGTGCATRCVGVVATAYALRVVYAVSAVRAACTVLAGCDVHAVCSGCAGHAACSASDMGDRCAMHAVCTGGAVWALCAACVVCTECVVGAAYVVCAMGAVSAVCAVCAMCAVRAVSATDTRCAMCDGWALCAVCDTERGGSCKTTVLCGGPRKARGHRDERTHLTGKIETITLNISIGTGWGLGRYWTTKMTIRVNTELRDLKQAIHNMGPPPIQDQLITLNNHKHMFRNATLRDYGLRTGDRIDVVPRGGLRGGSETPQETPPDDIEDPNPQTQASQEAMLSMRTSADETEEKTMGVRGEWEQMTEQPEFGKWFKENYPTQDSTTE